MQSPMIEGWDYTPDLDHVEPDDGDSGYRATGFINNGIQATEAISIAPFDKPNTLFTYVRASEVVPPDEIPTPSTTLSWNIDLVTVVREPTAAPGFQLSEDVKPLARDVQMRSADRALRHAVELYESREAQIKRLAAQYDLPASPVAEINLPKNVSPFAKGYRRKIPPPPPAAAA